MKKFLSVIIAAFSMSLVVAEADAASKRFGGGGNVGKQRSEVTQQQAAPKAPAQQQTSGGSRAQQPSGMSKWLGPLAGLAIGAGLASLFFNNGLGGALAGMLMVGLLVAAAIFAVRYFMRGRTAPAAAAAVRGRAARPRRCRHRSRCREAPARNPLPPPWAARPPRQAAPAWPAGFDAAAFTRQAKVNFVNMQAANDKRDLSTMRDFLTPEMYREIEANLRVGVGDAAEDGGRNPRRRGDRRDHRKRSLRRQRALHRA